MRYHKRTHATSKPFYQKVGGLHFIRFWRIRVSFCLARPTLKQETFNERTVIHERYLTG